MTDPQKWTDTPSPTQLRDFYAGTVLGLLEQVRRETEAAVENGVIDRYSGKRVFIALEHLLPLFQPTVHIGPSSPEAETRVMK